MWFVDSIERHLLVLYFYSILAGFGVALYVAWSERQGIPRIGEIFAALGLGLVMAILGPYTVVISLHELFKENVKKPGCCDAGLHDRHHRAPLGVPDRSSIPGQCCVFRAHVSVDLCSRLARDTLFNA